MAINNAMTGLGDLAVYLTANLDGFNRGLISAKSRLDKFVRSSRVSLGGLHENFIQLGRVATRVGLIMTAKIGIVVNEFTKFEKAMRAATAVTGLTDEQFQKMSAMAEQMSMRYNIAADQAAKAFLYLGRAGLSASEQMESYNAVVTMSKAAMIESAEAADILVGTMKGFNIAFSNTAHVTDVLSKAVISSNMNYTQLGQTLSMISGTSHAMNNSLEDTVALIATLADVNIRGTRSGVVLRRSMLNLASPVSEVKDIFREYGIDVYNANREMKPFIELVAEIGEKIKGVTEEEKMRVFERMFGARAIAGQLAIFDKAAENIQKFSNTLKSAGGTAQQIADKQMMALGEQLGIVGRQIQTLLRRVGGGLEPALRKLVTAVKPVLEATIMWADENKEVAQSLAESAAKIAITTLGVGALITSINLLVWALKPLVGVLAALTGLISAPFLALAAAVALAVTSVYFLRVQYKKFGGDFARDWQLIVDIFKLGVEKISEWWGNLTGWMDDKWGDTFRSVIDWFKTATNRMINGILYLKDVTTGLIGIFKGEGLPKMGDKDWVGQWVGATREGSKKAAEGIKLAGAMVAELWKEGWSETMSDVKDRFAKDFDAVTEALKAKFPDLVSFINGVQDQWKKFKSSMDSETGPTYAGITPVGSEEGKTLSVPKESSLVRRGLQKYYEDIREFNLFVISSFADSLSAVERSVGSAFSSLIDGTKKGKEALKDFARSVLDAFNKMISEMIARRMMLNIMEGLGFTGLAGGAGAGGSGGTPVGYDSIGSFAHTGGVVGRTQFSKRPIPAGIFANAPRLHKGLNSDEFPAILQKGERVIPRHRAGEQSRGSNVEINVINKSSQPVTAKKGNTSFDGNRYITSVILEDLNQNGPIRNAIRGMD